MTTEGDYRSISCAAYDEIEILAMHRSRVEVTWLDERGNELRSQGRLLDTAIHDKAEFLVLLESEGKCEIRLDRVCLIDDLDSGGRWHQELE